MGDSDFQSSNVMITKLFWSLYLMFSFAFYSVFSNCLYSGAMDDAYVICSCCKVIKGR